MGLAPSSIGAQKPEDDTRDVFAREGLPPRGIWWCMRKAGDLLRQLPIIFAPAPYALYTLAMGYQLSQVIAALAGLCVADHLKDGPKSAATLAREIGAHEDRLFRVLRAAVNSGVFKVSKQRGSKGEVLFANNRISALLRDDHENCLKYLILNNAKMAWTAWGELEWAVRTGGDPYERVNGQPVWEHFKANPEKEATFTRAMKSVSSLGMAAVVEDYRWGSFDRLVDIGGNSGHGLLKLLLRYPKPTGICFDQPQVIKAVLADQKKGANGGEYELLKRISFVGGSFFDPETLPAVFDGDVLFLRVILHDWSDPDCVRILRSLRQAVGGKRAILAIVENVLKEPLFNNDLPLLFLTDIHMMVEQGGRERSFAEYSKLLLAAGWTAGKLIETRGPMSVIEALPAPDYVITPTSAGKVSSETNGHATASLQKTGGGDTGIHVVAQAQ